MTEHDGNAVRGLEGLDEARRERLLRLLRGSSFVAPVVASFAMQSISTLAVSSLSGNAGPAPFSARKAHADFPSPPSSQ